MNHQSEDKYTLHSSSTASYKYWNGDENKYILTCVHVSFALRMQNCCASTPCVNVGVISLK